MVFARSYGARDGWEDVGPRDKLGYKKIKSWELMYGIVSIVAILYHILERKEMTPV